MRKIVPALILAAGLAQIAGQAAAAADLYDCPHGPSGQMVEGYTYYKPVATGIPGKCKWVVDTEAMRQAEDAEQKRVALWIALQTRVLTPAEMRQVEAYGSLLNVQPNTPFSPMEKARELNDALSRQLVLQAQAHERRN